MMNHHLSDYDHCVAKLKTLAGIADNKPKSIREALRDDSFEDTILEAVHCRLMDNWTIREQQKFVESLAGMNEAQVRVRIHEVAYELYRADKQGLVLHA